MSGNRANAAAIQRRTNGAQPQQPVRKPQVLQPPPLLRQQRGQPIPVNQNQGVRQQYQQPPQQYQQQENPNFGQPKPKMSVSDAIGLITLRLGRIETIMNTLPPLEQISTTNVNASDVQESNRIVDEAVFTSIVTRLQKIEEGDEVFVGNITTRIDNTEDSISKLNTRMFDVEEKITTINSNLISITDYLTEIKNIIEALQESNFNVNKKLDDFITSCTVVDDSLNPVQLDSSAQEIQPDSQSSEITSSVEDQNTSGSEVQVIE